MNLAVRDILRRPGRLIGVSAGLGLLFAVVIAMQGIYAGMTDDAIVLVRAMGADFWVVQQGTHGPFAEASRLDPTVEDRARTVPGVRRARAYTYWALEVDHAGRRSRLALVGVSWPGDRGSDLPLVAGRGLEQAHGELIADLSLGLEIGEHLELGGERYRVVGLTKNALTSGGESLAFMSVADSQLVASELPDEAIRLERQRRLGRLQATDLGRAQPGLEDLAVDARWQVPALPSAAINAVLINLDAGFHAAGVRRVIDSWPDVSVYSSDAQRQFLLEGVIQRARMQIGLFTLILTLTAAVIVMMVIYGSAVEKTHDIAVLKLMGATMPRLVAFVVQQSWLLGVLAYAVARGLGALVFPAFPRRVLLTPAIEVWSPISILLLVTLASVLGVVHVTRVDVSRVLEG